MIAASERHVDRREQELQEMRREIDAQKKELLQRRKDLTAASVSRENSQQKIRQQRLDEREDILAVRERDLLALLLHALVELAARLEVVEPARRGDVQQFLVDRDHGLCRVRPPKRAESAERTETKREAFARQRRARATREPTSPS